MLLTTAVITSGALIATVTVYKQNKRKQETPWTVYAEKHGIFKKEKGRFKRWKNTFFNLVSGESHDTPKIQDSSLETYQREISEEEEEINSYIAASLGLLGLTTLGSVSYPFFTLLSVPGLIYLSIPIFKDSYEDLFKERRIGTNLIDSLALIVLLGGRYFWICSLIYTIYGFSEKLLLRVKDNSKQKLTNIFGELPSLVWLQQGEIEVQVPLCELQADDIVIVHAGEIIPVDGTIADGVGSIDQRMLTGEAQPVELGIGDTVFASSLVLAGKVYIRVEKRGHETIVAKIGQILDNTTSYTSELQLKGEVLAEKCVTPTLALGLVTWPILGIQAVTKVLMLACFGQEMKILAPLSILNYLNLASSQHILIKDGRALEALQDVDTVVFDKTGTLTIEQPHVAAIYSCGDLSENDLLRYAAAAEYKQTHPIALAIREYAKERQLTLPSIQDTSIEIGYGLRVWLNNQLIRVGSKRFMAIEGLAMPAQLQELQGYAHEQGYSLVYVAIDNHIEGAIELHATIRKEAKEIIQALRKRKLDLYIISGDHEKPTERLAQELGIDHYFAETLPENKAELIEQLQQQGKSVCFVGDGINDAIALKKANVSVSLRGASTVATDTAQIILMDQSLNQLNYLFDLAKDLDANMKINFMITIVPSSILVGSIYLTKLNLVPLLLLAEVGALAGVANAMWPRLRSEG
jgi:Cu2+-exporting ATPase